MKRPKNVLETKEYIEPNTFENDQESILFYAYLEQEKYINELTKAINFTDSSTLLKDEEVIVLAKKNCMLHRTSDELGFLVTFDLNDLKRFCKELLNET